jgi:hypothetical protein
LSCVFIDVVIRSSWVPARFDQSPSGFNGIWPVELKKVFRYAALSSQWNNARFLEPKMSPPPIDSWIEQPHNPTSLKINRGDVTSLESIAHEARPRQVVLMRLASVFARHDVIDCMGKSRVFFV